MPGMPRINKKSTDIAFKILGVPPNMATKPTKKQYGVDQQVGRYDARLVR